MKILHVIATLAPSAGGPPMVAACLAAAQQSLGNQVTIAAYSRKQEADEQRIALERIPYLGDVRIESLGEAVRFERLVPIRAARKLKNLARRHDIVELHGIWEPLLLAAARSARRASLPYVVMPHGMLDVWSLQQKSIKKRLALGLFYRRMLNGASILHLCNADEAEGLKSLQLTSKQAFIPNGVFLEEIEPRPAIGTFRQKHPELQDRPFLLFMSRLHFKKGLDLLADAFVQIAPEFTIDLVIAGPEDGAGEDFAARVKAAGLEHRVHMVGPIYGREKYAALTDATAFVLPSRQEGFSIAITEALACSRPVVITETCHFPEVAEVKAGEVVPLQAEEVAGGIRRVLSNPDAAESMGRAGRKLVESRYTWQRIAEQSVEAYRRAGAKA